MRIDKGILIQAFRLKKFASLRTEILGAMLISKFHIPLAFSTSVCLFVFVFSFFEEGWGWVSKLVTNFCTHHLTSFCNIIFDTPITKLPLVSSLFAILSLTHH